MSLSRSGTLYKVRNIFVRAPRCRLAQERAKTSQPDMKKETHRLRGQKMGEGGSERSEARGKEALQQQELHKGKALPDCQSVKLTNQQKSTPCSQRCVPHRPHERNKAFLGTTRKESLALSTPVYNGLHNYPRTSRTGVATHGWVEIHGITWHHRIGAEYKYLCAQKRTNEGIPSTSIKTERSFPSPSSPCFAPL